MVTESTVRKLQSQGRQVQEAIFGDDDLGPLQKLPGTWRNEPNLIGRGWNMIALPSATEPESRINYRLLVNQYNEELKFSLVDKGVPNRGIARNGGTVDSDQFVVTLDYEQMIAQVSADDFPATDKAGDAGLPIHHEPGLWLHMTNETTNGLDIARLATIPHGDSALALGTSKTIDGAASIPRVNGLPIGVPQNLDGGYLSPYKHYNDNPFKGIVNAPGFPGFNPVNPQELLALANDGLAVRRTTILEVDTSVEKAGIRNIPFINKQANAADMKSTFWIQELEETDESGEPKLRLQYLQVVLLDFFPRFDGSPGLIRWPHVSINTLEKVAPPNPSRAYMPSA